MKTSPRVSKNIGINTGYGYEVELDVNGKAYRYKFFSEDNFNMYWRMRNKGKMLNQIKSFLIKENKMANEILSEPAIFTTGAHLRPIKVQTEHGERYVWTVTEFEEDSYQDGKTIDPDTIAETPDKLVNRIGEE